MDQKTLKLLEDLGAHLASAGPYCGVCADGGEHAAPGEELPGERPCPLEEHDRAREELVERIAEAVAHG